MLCVKFLVLLRFSKSCKRSFSPGFVKKTQIRIQLRCLDESIINLCIQLSSHSNLMADAIFAKLRPSAAIATPAQPLLSEQIVQ